MKLMQRHQKIFGLTSAFESSVQNSKCVDMAYSIFIFLSENESSPIVTQCNIIKFLATQPRLSVSVPQSWFWYRKVGSMKSEFLYKRMLLGNESATFTAHPVAFAGVSFSIRGYLGRTFSRNGSVSPYIFGVIELVFVQKGRLNQNSELFTIDVCCCRKQLRPAQRIQLRLQV